MNMTFVARIMKTRAPQVPLSLKCARVLLASDTCPLTKGDLKLSE